MKNFVKRLGIIAFVAIILFSMVGCDLDKDDNILDGTWIGVDNDYQYIFSGSNYTLKVKDGSSYTNSEKGTFSLNSSKTRYTQKGTHKWQYGSWVSYTSANPSCDIVISGSSFTLTGHGESGWSVGGYFTETYTKQ